MLPRPTIESGSSETKGGFTDRNDSVYSHLGGSGNISCPVVGTMRDLHQAARIIPTLQDFLYIVLMKADDHRRLKGLDLARKPLSIYDLMPFNLM